MKNLSEFQAPLQFLFTDIDDTLTDEGRLGPEAYEALWSLHNAGVHVIPLTGRPAGWCELIARQWPVTGVIGENGAFYFRYHQQKMTREFAVGESTRLQNAEKMKTIENEIFKKVPRSALSSDQFCRLFDLAIDFCEDIPRLTENEIQTIVEIFKSHGAQAKVSSIHVNGWFGHHDKMTQALYFLKKEFELNQDQARQVAGFVGDSPNDEPMFAFFPHSFAVSNIKNFIHQLKAKPTYVALQPGGLGFCEVAERILKNRQSPI